MKDIFHSAALRLTGWYLLLIMVLSVGLSLALYHISDNDLTNNAQRQIGYFDDFLGPTDFSNYRHLREKQLNEDRAHLKGNFILFNFFVLIAGGVASYGLARRTMQPIEEAMDSQKRFTSDASHELRTPLTIMAAENEVALRNKSLTKTQAVNLIKSNLEEVAKLKTLSEGLLKLAASEDLDVSQQISLKDLVGDSIIRVSKLAKTKKIKLIDDVQDTSFRGHRQYLEELVAILLDNAIKYSQPNSQIKIAGAKRDRSIKLSVKDSGRGIEANDLPHIFERFYQSDSSRNKQQISGYGLGLAIAKKIVELHHGSIEVRSAPKKGSVFTIRLPA